MIIKSVKLTNFRNYKKQDFNFEKVTVIYGPNGIGKSNILEAIVYLSYAKSFRASDERNVINQISDYAQISGKLVDGKNINFVISKDQSKIKKQVKVDKISKGITELVGIFKTVIFTPDSLNIITGSPGVRRRFLNTCISQLNKAYLDDLIMLKKVLKQRNQLLKVFGQTGKIIYSQIDFWNEKMVLLTKNITDKRKEFIRFLNENIEKTYKDISGKEDIVKIKYISGSKDEEKFGELLATSTEREVVCGKTLYGPHLDNFLFLINGSDISETGSRGEIRSLALCLKVLEIEYLEKMSGDDKVLLLLDDVFSELDDKRRSKIFKIIKQRQTIITTTDKLFIDDKLAKDINFINLIA